VESPEDELWTVERPASGLSVVQPRRGFRYGSEAFWLVGFAIEGGGIPRLAVDLGTGSGIAALLLGRLGAAVEGVDVRREWLSLWAHTLDGSQVGGRVQLHVHDVSDGPPATGVDLVVCNPPFFPEDAGPRSEDAWKGAARTESSATLERFVEVGMACLAPHGRACWVVPRERWEEVVFEGAVQTRVVHVGRRRTLVELGYTSKGGYGEAIEVPDRGDVVDRWYALATAAPEVRYPEGP
jgi:tRNA1(Val) A37 N6-methylase TrmN6